MLVNATDIMSHGFAEDADVDIVPEWTRPDGSIEERRAEEFRIAAYRIPRENAAAWHPKRMCS